MAEHGKKFLFVGNGPYQNRGCEAIVRGTMEILRHEFGRDISVQSGVQTGGNTVRKQNENEIDPAIRSFSVSATGPRLALKWWAAQANKRLGAQFAPHTWSLRNPALDAEVVLELGGDNYSLDYGRPEGFMAMDRVLLARKLPVVLWGASVGPFDADPEFATRMFDHLRKLTAIFVRESESLNYLQANGVTHNVHTVADPAFVMKPVEPAANTVGFALPEGAIGINLSPLLARFSRAPNGPFTYNGWLAFCIGLVGSAAKLNRPILLIPHVESSSPDNDDFGFLHSVFQATANTLRVPVQVLPRGLNAAELKWIIARCVVFAGARTHSTIAALSSGVPTLSLGYSLKAKGINKDIFGHLDHCLPVTELDSATFCEKLAVLLAGHDTIKSHLAAAIPGAMARAIAAGPLLRSLI